MDHNSLTYPLISYTPLSAWYFNDLDLKTPRTTLYQEVPSLFSVADLVDFVKDCYDHKYKKLSNIDSMQKRLEQVPNIKVPGFTSNQNSFIYSRQNAADQPKDELAKVVWQAWNTMIRPEETTSRRYKPKDLRSFGMVWEVWHGKDIFDGAFKLFDAAKRLVPVYNIARCPFPDLTDRINAPMSVAAVFDAL